MFTLTSYWLVAIFSENMIGRPDIWFGSLMNSIEETTNKIIKSLQVYDEVSRCYFTLAWMVSICFRIFNQVLSLPYIHGIRL